MPTSHIQMPSAKFHAPYEGRHGTVRDSCSHCHHGESMETALLALSLVLVVLEITRTLLELRKNATRNNDV